MKNQTRVQIMLDKRNDDFIKIIVASCKRIGIRVTQKTYNDFANDFIQIIDAYNVMYELLCEHRDDETHNFDDEFFDAQLIRSCFLARDIGTR